MDMIATITFFMVQYIYIYFVTSLIQPPPFESSSSSCNSSTPSSPQVDILVQNHGVYGHQANKGGGVDYC